MRSLRDIPVKQKLILIIFVVSGTALLLASGAAFLHNVFILRHSLAHEVTALANIVAVNAAAPLAFRDGEAAREVLTALGAEPRVLLACIHDKEGRVLAAYLRDRRRDDVHAAREPRHQHAAAGRSLLESRPVILDGEEIGTVYIRYDLSALDTLLARSALVTAAVLVVATCAAVALSWFLQRLISVPILQLTDVAKLITRHGDYSVRAEKHGDDEIGVLIDGFNAMLNQIQTRDAELQHHQERLEEQVERRTEELRQANEELKREISERESAQNRRRELEAQLRQKQKLASVGTLAGGVAHEINNPINGIMNYAQLIVDRHADDERITTYAEEILHETERVSRIVRNLLAFSRQEAQQSNVAKIEDVLDATLSLVQTIVRRDRIVLDLDIPAGLPSVRCRSQQIQQVFMNLMTNARDALNERYPGHSPDKKIRVAAGEIVSSGKRWVRTTVEDHGSGIAPDIRDRLFDPFFTTKSRAESAGLGLAISYGIVLDHGGRLDVESELGQFTRFHLDLPIAEPPDEPAAPLGNGAPSCTSEEDSP